MTLETVLYDVRDGIAHVRLNRPHRLNAMVPRLMDDLHRALQAAASDPAVRVVILSGEGRAFCAGDDLKESAQGHGDVGSGPGVRERDPAGDGRHPNRCRSPSSAPSTATRWAAEASWR